MKKALMTGVMVLIGVGLVSAQFDDPFAVGVTTSPGPDGSTDVTVTFEVPPEHYLYASALGVAGQEGLVLTPVALHAPKQKYDAFEEKEVGVHDETFTQRYRVAGPLPAGAAVTVSYQGCSDSLCFPPESKPLALSAAGAASPVGVPETEAPPTALDVPAWQAQADRFEMARKASGYMAADDFLDFLEGDDAVTGPGGETSGNDGLAGRGIWVTVLLILLGGMALNLTPCVLPMIPVNIAIIGAGSQAGSRSRGFALGATYGAGIALVYGMLGLAVVLTGARFGALNSTPIFNFVIAVVFLLMSLSMFGVFNVDLTRFQSGVGSGGARRGSFLPAFMLGGLAALLAGACVAPVVISVLLLAAKLYHAGNVGALVLPFVLGLGMALPWPFAGAGLSFLPKPGQWMERIKYGFGVIILLAALYYGVVGVNLLRHRGTTPDFAEQLRQAEKDGRPVLVDFWATWCKNCSKMEKVAFHDPEVARKLDQFVLLKYQAENMNDPQVKAVLDYYGVLGLPSYAILIPREEK